MSRITSLTDATCALERVVKFTRPEEGVALFLWAGQERMLHALSTVFYLGFRGPTGSGKGTAIEACLALTQKGIVLSDTTEAYLESVLDESRPVGIQELGRLLRSRDRMLQLLLNGYRAGSSGGGKMVKNKDTDQWERKTINTYGPKAFDFHTSLDGHLLSRTVVIEMVPDRSVERALSGEFKADELAPVREWLDTEAEKKLSTWTAERIRHLWRSREFQRRVRALGGDSGRDHVIGSVMLTVSDAFGWGVDPQVASLIARNRKVSDDIGDEAEVAQAILTMTGGAGGAASPLSVADILKSINDDRYRLRLPPMTQAALAGVLIDLRFERGKTYLKHRGTGPLRDRWVIHVTDENAAYLARVARAAPTTEADGPARLDGPEDHQEGAPS